MNKTKGTIDVTLFCKNSYFKLTQCLQLLTLVLLVNIALLEQKNIDPNLSTFVLECSLEPMLSRHCTEDNMPLSLLNMNPCEMDFAC